MPHPLPPRALPLDRDATQTVVVTDSPLIVQTRRIRAPRARVWAAWTDPAQLGQWWGPAGFSLTTALFEFREGGHWIFTMHGPDPDPATPRPGMLRDFPNHVQWTHIRSGAHPGGPESGPWTLAFRHLQGERVLFTATVSLDALDTETLLTWRSDFGTEAQRDQMIHDFGAAQGGRETTARLAAHTEGPGFDQTASATGHRLMLSRILPVPRALVWRAWTEPDRLMQWFCPRPYRVDDCTLDLRPGGRFHTHMVGPGDWSCDNEGSYLEVVAGERLTFTDLLHADWTPAPAAGLGFTASVVLEDAPGGGTRYTACARHADDAGRARHAAMGFHEGWGTATDQLVQALQGD